jgi:hypothetical protein
MPEAPKPCTVNVAEIHVPAGRRRIDAETNQRQADSIATVAGTCQ